METSALALLRSAEQKSSEDTNYREITGAIAKLEGIRENIIQRIADIRGWQAEGSGEPETLRAQLEANLSFLALLDGNA